MEEVIKYAKNITYIRCGDCSPRPNQNSMISSVPKKMFWHNIANNYILIKKEIIDLSNKIIYKLFRNSKNILGVLARGTDYIARKPKSHPIPPDVDTLINDVKMMDNIYKYDYIFFSTEDERIRVKFTNYFKLKIKQLKPKIDIEYDL